MTLSRRDLLPGLAFLLAWLGLGAVLHAEDKPAPEIFKTVSPDKLYEVREAGDERETTSLSALYLRKGDRQLIDFAAEYALKGKVENTETQWRKDSRAFAFHYAFLRMGSTVIYRKEGDTFRAMKLPKLPPMQTDAGKVIPDVKLNIQADTVYPVRWQKDGTLVLEEFRIYNGGEWETTYRKIVVGVPEKGPLILKSVKRIEVSQREEVNQ